jgi:hypothetical protein
MPVDDEADDVVAIVSDLIPVRIQRGKIEEIFFAREVSPRLRQEIPTVFGKLISPEGK